jgi:hypothetical protein
MCFIIIEEFIACLYCFSEDNADVGEARSEYLGPFVGYGVDSEVDCREEGVSDGDWEQGIVALGELGMAFETTGWSVVLVVVHRERAPC